MFTSAPQEGACGQLTSELTSASTLKPSVGGTLCRLGVERIPSFSKLSKVIDFASQECGFATTLGINFIDSKILPHLLCLLLKKLWFCWNCSSLVE